MAIQLGMVDKAKSLYENNNKHDLYSKIYKKNGQINKSILIA